MNRCLLFNVANTWDMKTDAPVAFALQVCHACADLIIRRASLQAELLLCGHDGAPLRLQPKRLLVQVLWREQGGRSHNHAHTRR